MGDHAQRDRCTIGPAPEGCEVPQSRLDHAARSIPDCIMAVDGVSCRDSGCGCEPRSIAVAQWRVFHQSPAGKQIVLGCNQSNQADR